MNEDNDTYEDETEDEKEPLPILRVAVIHNPDEIVLRAGGSVYPVLAQRCWITYDSNGKEQEIENRFVIMDHTVGKPKLGLLPPLIVNGMVAFFNPKSKSIEWYPTNRLTRIAVYDQAGIPPDVVIEGHFCEKCKSTNLTAPPEKEMEGVILPLGFEAKYCKQCDLMLMLQIGG